MYWEKKSCTTVLSSHATFFLSWKLKDLEKCTSLLQVADKLDHRRLNKHPSLWVSIRLTALVQSNFIINTSQVWMKLNWNNLDCNDKMFWYPQCLPLEIINYDRLIYRKSCLITYTLLISSLPIAKWDFTAFVRINLVPSATQGYVSWKLW